MEGDGMVAIVQGLRDAGLAVTLVNRTHLLQNALLSKAVPVKSSVDAGTDAGRTSAQVQDEGHYTSSYRMAHCSIRSSSPPERLTEFPSQRAEPCRNQGNFQTSGYGTQDYNYISPLNTSGSSQPFRGGMVWPDRGSAQSGRVWSPIPSQTDAFVHSLRRYPSRQASPQRTVSAELVQRLLSYTQNKHLAKNSSVKTSFESSINTSTKNIQTYTRAKQSKDNGANTTNDIRFDIGKQGKCFGPPSYRVRARAEQYEYLKIPRRGGRSPEVRYLNDVRRCIRDTIKHMCEDTPVVCPQIRSRYSQHKKEHHRNSTEESIPQTSHPKLCCFCKKPMPCSCKPGTSNIKTTFPSDDPLVIGQKTHTKEKEEEPVIDVPPAVPPPEAIDKGICTCKSDGRSENKVEKEIFNWIKGIPVYADDSPDNKSKREEMVKDLAEKLKKLESDKDCESRAKDYIMKCVEKLPMWYPDGKHDRETYKKQIADDLFSRFISNNDKNDDFKNVIAKWLDNVKFEDEIVEKEKIVDIFFNRLKPLLNKPDDMKIDIDNILQELPIFNKSETIGKLADQLNKNLTDLMQSKLNKSSSSSDIIPPKRIDTGSLNVELENTINDWLKDVPELPNDIIENNVMVKNLVETLKTTQELYSNDEEKQEKMNEEVIDWLDTVLKINGNKLDYSRKNEIANRLLDKLVWNDFSEIKISAKNTYFDKEIDLEGEIWDCLEDIADIPKDNKKVVQNQVKKLAEKLQNFRTESTNEDSAIEEEIINFVKNLSKTGALVSSENKNILVKKLSHKIKSKSHSKRWSEDDCLQHSVQSEISELIEDIPSNISKTTRKEIIYKVANILTRNFDHLSDKNDNISSEIVNILQKYAKIPENEAAAVTSALITRVKGMPLPNQSIFLPSQRSLMSENEIKQYVLEEINDIFNDYNVSQKVTKEVEKEIMDALTDEIVRGTDNIRTKDNIVSILQKANVTDEVADEISSRLLAINKELSFSYKTQDSKLGISRNRCNKGKLRSPMEKDDFEENAEKELLDFVGNLTGRDSPKTRQKRKVAAEELVNKLGDIMSGPDDANKEKSIIDEVSQFLRKLSLDLDISKEEAQKLADRLQSVGFQASTPKKEGLFFYPRRDMIDISGIHIDDDDSATQRYKQSPQVKSKEEKEYVLRLQKIIQSWMDEALTGLSVTENKRFNETLIQDLADDIIDRQKYLQLNPEAKTSNQEELEHLKYQVFRWLNKLLDVDNLSSVMQQTEVLMNKIKDVDIPELFKPIEKQGDAKTGEEFIPDTKESIKDEISLWIEEIPKKLIEPIDKKIQTQMISELANKIEKLRATNQTSHIDNEITNWLSKLIQNADKQELTKLSEALKARLKERGFTEVSFIPSQDSSQFIEENLTGAIKDWLKSLPWYQTRNSMEKHKGESIILELVKGLKCVFEAAQTADVVDTEKMIFDEIMKQLDKLPMDMEQKSDKEFIHKIAEQLLNYLKDLQVFQNISERRDVQPDDYLTASLEDWFSSLPIPEINSSEFEKLKTEFTHKIKQIRQEDPKNEIKLKNEIRSYLSRFPTEDSVRNNQKLLNDMAEKLYLNLLWVPIENEQRYTSDTFVKNAVNNWMKLLPLPKGKTVDDIPHNAVEKLTSAVAELLVNTNVIKISEISQILENETDTFLKNVPLDPNVPYETKNWSQALFMQVKEMSRKLSNQPIVSATPPTPTKKAADILFNDIERWCDNLPIKEGTPEETERAKKDLASKVVHKIGELNVNPEIFNDDLLYHDLLEEEIDMLLTNLSSEHIKKNLPTIKNDLITKVKEARLKTQEETAGQAYKQQLREAISRTMPTESLTEEEWASFEVLKDNLADAFINLHYVGEDEKLKNMYKIKIHDKVSTFCNDYLKKHPASPIDSKQLNQDLYNALKGVPIPKEETIRNEVELVKVKDEVNEWVKELPLKEQHPTDKIHTNKIIAVLSKKIHEIEKEKALYPVDTTDEKLRKEITKWVKKLPLNVDDEEIIILTDKLVNNLKNTEKSRKVSASTRHSIEPDTFDFTPPSSELPKTCQPSGSDSCQSHMLPPSSLTFEDREHLQRIRERSATSRNQYSLSKDASVSPLPVDAGSQTEIRPWETPTTCGRRLTRQNSGVQTLKPPQQKAMQAVGSQAEMSPHVIVKEYYWDPTDASKRQGLCAPCPSKLPTTPCQSSRSERPVSVQPSQYTPPGSACPHVPLTSSPQASYGSQTPRRPRKEWEQPCYSREMPGASSEDHAEPGTSFKSREKVTRLGSFDGTESKNNKPKEWKFAEDEFWGDKRRFLSDEDDGPVFKERRKEEEKVSCRCKERILTKCNVRKRGRGCHTAGQSNDDVKRCSKCCGIHCPYPSYLYFRQ